jgi:acetamidase/formamidase
MDDDFRDITEPSAYLPRVKDSEPPAGTHPQHGPKETVREATYQGHRIVIRTTYEIEVDGEPVSGHLGVANDGRVHYHPVPNLSFPSAVDLVKTLIDTFPDDFEGGDGHGHGGHGGGHH